MRARRETKALTLWGWLVGPPGFEPGTSCTTNTGLRSFGPVVTGVFYSSQGFGASATARCRWRWIDFLHTFLRTVHGKFGALALTESAAGPNCLKRHPF